MTLIRCMLDEAACISKHQPGILQGDRIILYSEWNDLAGAVAKRLRDAGVGSGDRVAVFMATDWRALVLIMGVIRAGAIACPISTRLPRTAVLDHMDQLGSRHIIAFLSGKNDAELSGIHVLSPETLLAAPEQGITQAVMMTVDAPALILFTSGSSGQSRPAVLSYGNLYYNAHGANANMRLHSKDKWLLNLPLYHVSGIGVMFRCMLGGASVLIPEQKETLPVSIDRYHPTHLSIVPAQLYDLLEAGEIGNIAAVRAFLVGGSACDPELVEKSLTRKWPIYLTYGMTETGSQIATMTADAPPPKRVGTSGKPLRHRTVRVSEDGEILVRGPCVFKGYWLDGKIVPALDDEGWFHTGDLGSIDKDGFLTVLGRKDALIISGGENIQPEEIERLLGGFAGIEQVLVVPVPHPRFGQRPVAFVRTSVWDDQAWRKQLVNILPGFKVPDAFLPWPEHGQDGIKPSRKAFAAIAEQKLRK